MKINRTRATLAAAAMTAGLAGGLAAPAQAAPAQAVSAPTASVASLAAADSARSARSYYGAIALNTRTLAVGYTYNTSTRYWAERGAKNRCKKYSWKNYCKNVVWVRNGCASVAVKYDSKGRPVRYHSAYGKYKWSTINLARKRAGLGSTKGTKTRAYVCTTRYY